MCRERGDDIYLTAGTGVQSYTNKKLIYKHNKTKCVATPYRKRSVRISREPYDSTKDCLFCGNKVETSKVSFDYDHYSCVRTFACCKTSPFSDEVTHHHRNKCRHKCQYSEPFHREHRRGDEHGRASCVLVFAQTHECSEDTSINQSRHSR